MNLFGPGPRPYRQGKDNVRKLPPYDILKKHYVDEGMTYSQIAKKYGVSGGASAVGHTLSRRARNRGEWPLTPRKTASQKIRDYNKAKSINGIAIWGLVCDYREDHEMTWGRLADKFGISVKTCYDRQCKINHRRPLRMRADKAVHLLECIGEPIPDWLRELGK